MIKIHIDKVGDKEIFVSLTSQSGGKLALKDVEGVRVRGITKKFPVKLILSEDSDYYITDNKLNYIGRQIDEFSTN